MRQTKQKQAIFQAMMDFDGHPTAEEIYHVLKQDYPKLSLATVYRNLNQYTEASLLGRVMVDGAPLHFDHNPTPHGHFICRKCNRIWDIDAPELSDAAAFPSLANNMADFRFDSLTYQFEGLCPDCQKKSSR